jgi:[ribosomal protein S5]-alanine N-acetyltransferase
VPPHLATERLALAPLTLADAEAAQELFPHWEIVRYLASPPVPWPFPPDGALSFYRDVALPAMARGEQWTWTLRTKAAPERMIGIIELSNAEHNNRGFWLGLPWHGRGYMTEACEAAADFWFDVLGRSILCELRAAANIASRRIAEKTGMRLVATGTKSFVAGMLPSELWAITREEWRAHRRTRHRLAQGRA